MLSASISGFPQRAGLVAPRDRLHAGLLKTVCLPVPFHSLLNSCQFTRTALELVDFPPCHLRVVLLNEKIPAPFQTKVFGGFNFLFASILQVQQQRSLDGIVSHPPKASGRKPKKDMYASPDPEVKNTSPMSEQDSGILDVEDEEEDEEARTSRMRGGGSNNLREVPGAQDLVDFSPVYRCLHIYSVLVSEQAFCLHIVAVLTSWSGLFNMVFENQPHFSLSPSLMHRDQCSVGYEKGVSDKG
ncbi:hypothetical protein JD844_025995 [Phrynosoma platyrhinos]|uniref:Uncharacterized protein n=1 Tax=Phrynosoma platyrhinos TaxID=52577 RepID=A0ABQ7SEC8_PHRPL|nr:hypothetical protein JD844_025995 [Phrynosoma platyrhinos]